MDFGTTLSYVSFYLVSMVIAYYFFTTRNKERMALIEAGANPDMFDSVEKYYLFFIVALVAIGIALGLFISLFIQPYFPDQKSIIAVSSMLLCGGTSLLISFFTIQKWISREK